MLSGPIVGRPEIPSLAPPRKHGCTGPSAQPCFRGGWRSGLRSTSLVGPESMAPRNSITDPAPKAWFPALLLAGRADAHVTQARRQVVVVGQLPHLAGELLRQQGH